MAQIQAKRKPVVKKGSGIVYIPSEFHKHTDKRFIETDDPQVILNNIKPFSIPEAPGRKFITFDTETHPNYSNSHLVPQNVVRRWVGTGKKATPQDFPFSLQFCDGIRAYTIYDSIEDGFPIFKQLAPLFEDASIEFIAHNTKFDMHGIANTGMKIVGKLHDTVVLAKLANENRKNFTLWGLAEELPNGITKFECMVDNYKKANRITDYRNIPRELLTQYGCADVWNCYEEFITDYKVIVKEELVDLYNQEMDTMVALYAMERYGMRLDKDIEDEMKDELQCLADKAEKAIYEEAGGAFNINSGAQLYKVLMNLGVNHSWIPTTAAGNPSLDKDVLNTLANTHNINIVKNILEFRKYEKLLTTYAIGIYGQHDEEARVHGSINQTEATTGRMSITKPALQTLPKKDTRIRRAFIPNEDYDLWFMDLDQIEYRLYAHYAKIPSLIESIKNGYDVHAATAAMIFHVPLDKYLGYLKEYEHLGNQIKDLEQEANEEGMTRSIADEIQCLEEQQQDLKKFVDMRAHGKTINFALAN